MGTRLGVSRRLRGAAGTVWYKPCCRVHLLPRSAGMGSWMGFFWLEEQPGVLQDPVVIHLYYEFFIPAYKEYVAQAAVNAG